MVNSKQQFDYVVKKLLLLHTMFLRQAFSVLLAVHLLLMAWFPVFVFKQQQFLVRKEMKKTIKNGVPEEERLLFYADQLEADDANLTWIHDWEFRYHGEMYDILERKTIEGKLVYVCIHDVKESGLFARLDKMVEKGLESNVPVQHQRKFLKVFSSSLFFAHASENQFTTNSFEEIYTAYSATCSNFYMPPSTPPPELMCAS